jgi:peptide/nickel transport system substrate-binding protein
VFLGAAVPIYGPVTPGNKKWFSTDVPQTPHDPARAKALLASIGLTDKNSDGMLEDAAGRPARFALLTQKGQTANERSAAVIRDELKKIGVAVDVVLLEGNALVGRFFSGDPYDAVFFTIPATDADPAMSLDFWLSSGGSRIWNLGQKKPATDWERQMDELMTRQTAALDDAERYKLFVDVQKIFAEHLPLVHFAAPRIYVAASSRAINLNPAVQRPQFLWAAETIAVKH